MKQQKLFTTPVPAGHFADRQYKTSESCHRVITPGKDPEDPRVPGTRKVWKNHSKREVETGRCSLPTRVSHSEKAVGF